MSPLTDQQVSEAISILAHCLDIMYIDWMMKTEGNETCFIDLKDAAKYIVEKSLNKTHDHYAEQIEGWKRNAK